MIAGPVRHFIEKVNSRSGWTSNFPTLPDVDSRGRRRRVEPGAALAPWRDIPVRLTEASMTMTVNPEVVGRIRSYADRIFDLLSEIEDEGGDVDEIAAGLLLVADRICEDYDPLTH